MVDGRERRRLAEEALGGYASGPDAPIEATADALERAADAEAVVLVEGISDQMALEALAERRGRDLKAERVAIVPIGGAQAAPRFFESFGPSGAGLRIAGMCDVAEERFFARGLTAAGLGAPQSRSELEALGVFVCVDDLESELLRAVGRPSIESLLESQGDLGSFRTLQKQPAWRGEPFEAQIHRWLRAGARRNLRYARLLTLAVDPADAPRPLLATLAAI